MDASESSGLAGSGFRPDIQGLRAVAVLLVLVFHIWPAALPGGYVGVDVFFVISGYLITGLLLREYERAGEISLWRFYAKRLRRLLPAATITLVAVAIATAILLPRIFWRDIAIEIAASTLYVENWWLAHQAVDYLAEDAVASPLRHYWSLSVEEHFYIVWPWAIAGLAWLASRPGGHFRGRVAAGISVVVVASLAHSAWLTHREPGIAYFATTTRVWELGLGALLREPGQSSADLVARGFLPFWERIRQAGGQVVALRDTPRFRGPGGDPVRCLARENARLADCIVRREDAVKGEHEDPAMLASRLDSAAHLIDMNDSICNPHTCEPVVGGVLVLRDSHHLTATYARSRAPALGEQVRARMNP